MRGLDGDQFAKLQSEVALKTRTAAARGKYDVVKVGMIIDQPVTMLRVAVPAFRVSPPSIVLEQSDPPAEPSSDDLLLCQLRVHLCQILLESFQVFKRYHSILRTGSQLCPRY